MSEAAGPRACKREACKHFLDHPKVIIESFKHIFCLMYGRKVSNGLSKVSSIRYTYVVREKCMEAGIRKPLHAVWSSIVWPSGIARGNSVVRNPDRSV